MGKLNQPRAVPYDFQVVAIDGWAWLFDDSERTYICSQTPMIWLEPLYSEEGDDYDYPPDSTYYPAAFVKSQTCVGVDVDPDYIGADVDHREAWDAAREEANANHLI